MSGSTRGEWAGISVLALSPTLPFLGPQGPPTYSPFRADLALDPVNSHLSYTASVYYPFAPFTAASVQTTEPLAHLRRDFDIGGLRLSDFEVRQKLP